MYDPAVSLIMSASKWLPLYRALKLNVPEYQTRSLPLRFSFSLELWKRITPTGKQPTPRL